MAKPRQYKYFHITVNPKNCDSTDRAIDFLTPQLVKDLDICLISKALQYSRVIELNGDKIGHHYHFVLYSSQKLDINSIETELYNIIGKYYQLSDKAQGRTIKTHHKSLTQANLCAGGYLTKTFKNGFIDKKTYITNINDDDLKSYRKEYETKLSTSAKGQFSVWVLDENKTPTWIRSFNEYVKALIEIEKSDDVELIKNNSSNFQKYYIHILQKYKIGFEYNNIKKFHRQIIEYLITDNNFTETDYETLVEFLQFKKDEIINTNYTSNGYQPESILKYWSIQ